jgi:pectate lyase
MAGSCTPAPRGEDESGASADRDAVSRAEPAPEEDSPDATGAPNAVSPDNVGGAVHPGGAKETPDGSAQNGIAPRKWSDVADAGFASVNDMDQNGTTGGAGGKIVTVSNQAALEKYATAKAPYRIRVEGAVTLAPKGREIRVASDKTIIGVGRTGEIVGGGFFLGSGIHNVIVRNLTIGGTFVEGDWSGKTQDFDGVQMDNAHHVWIDHCHFSRIGDGMIDSRKGTTYLTVSWNIFRDHNKTFGIGWTPRVAAQMTIHHNWFRNTNQRNPGVDNVLRAHLYNNYLQNVTAAGNHARGGTHMILQNSVFENVRDPHFCDSGSLVATGNIYRGTRGRQESRGPAFFDPGKFYTYTLDKAEDVPRILARHAGPQESIGRQ